MMHASHLGRAGSSFVERTSRLETDLSQIVTSIRCSVARLLSSRDAGTFFEKQAGMNARSAEATKQQRIRPPPMPLDDEATWIRARANSASADEARLVALTCVLAGENACRLLEGADPIRAPELGKAARLFLRRDRRARLVTFARMFSSAPSARSIRRLAERLDSEPLWYAALVCRTLMPDVREALFTASGLEKAWRLRLKPHPALLGHARRFASQCLTM